MKYEFKEGQWFDIRKLTDWQKQWCSDNLEFTRSAERHLNSDTLFPCNLFRFTSEYGFTCTVNVSSVNEITFNDFYWGEDEEESFDNLVYVEPEDDCKIKIENLSDEQKSFLNDTLNWDDNDRFLTLYSSDFKNLRYCSTDKSWWLSTCGIYECSELDISFNDIFKEVN